MPRLFAAFMFATVSLFAFGPTVALAVSPSEQSCTGNYTHENGTAQCTTHVGNSTNSQTTTTSGQGNTTNKPTCSGLGNSTSHC
jgi:hypothetical protein